MKHALKTITSSTLPITKVVTITTFCVAMAVVSACSSIGVSDGSLDYRDKQLLAPLDMAGESATAIQPAINLPAYQATSKDDFVNKKGNRFVMPRPTPELTVSKPSRVITTSQARQGVTNANTFAKALTENEHGVPILQVQAKPNATITKVTQILQAAKFKVIKPLTGSYLIVSNPVFDGERLLRIANTGSATTVMVTNPNNTLADVGEARYILNTLYAGL